MLLKEGKKRGEKKSHLEQEDTTKSKQGEKIGF